MTSENIKSIDLVKLERESEADLLDMTRELEGGEAPEGQFTKRFVASGSKTKG
jgi:hypothetical protein